MANLFDNNEIVELKGMLARCVGNIPGDIADDIWKAYLLIEGRPLTENPPCRTGCQGAGPRWQTCLDVTRAYIKTQEVNGTTNE